MRILQLRFKNLNSLTGEWLIDFTHPAFAADGIFAITGTTGAGKTTLLDAVCLALYGCTPRLNKISRSANEIMSRRTGECFAEVTFETQAGRFRCHWSQHRARKRPDGELQSPRHEIADADSGRIFEAKLRAVADQIETATGMDFDRFTRSMLLAQGGFATFLQAAADQRAPILEQITGTEIYSRISIHVHERRSLEHKKLDLILAELNGMQILDENDERQLQTDLERHRRQETELNQQLPQLNQALAWLAGMARLEEELRQLQTRREEWHERWANFAAGRHRLHRAMRGLELSGEHAALTTLRRQQEAEGLNRDECLAALPALKSAIEQTESAWRAAAACLEAKRVLQKEALPLIRKARELDLKLEEKKRPMQSAGDALAEQKSLLTALRSAHTRACADLCARRQALKELVAQLSRSAVDEQLVEHLAGIKGRCELYKERSQRRHAKLREVAAGAADLTAALARHQEQTAALEALQKEFAGIENEAALKKAELYATLAGRDIRDWRDALSHLEKKKNLLEKIAESVCTRSQTSLALGELVSRREALLIQSAHIEQGLQTWMDKILALERETQLLETQFALLKRIEDFETARRDLRDGQACPLCGAMEHPFAAGNIPVPDQTAQDLQCTRTALKKAQAGLSDLKVRHAETIKDLDQIDFRSRELSATASVAQTLIEQGLKSLGEANRELDLEKFLPHRQKEIQEELDGMAQMIGMAEAQAVQLEKLRQSSETAKESLIRAEHETRSADHMRVSARQAVERAKTEAVKLAEELDRAEADLLQSIAAYGIMAVSIDTLDQIQVELADRRNRWLERRSAKAQHEQAIAELAVQTRQQEEQIGRCEAEMKKLQLLLETLQSEQSVLIQERRRLLYDKHPDAEEASLAAALEKAAGELDVARRSQDAAHRECARLLSRLEALEKSIADRSGHIKAGQEAFAARLVVFGFSDEADYSAACLTEEERVDLGRQDRRLTDEETELAAAKREKEMLLQVERQKQLTDQSRESLLHTLSGLQNRQKDLQQEIGGIRRKLADNEHLKQLQQQRIQAIAAHTLECRRWDLLHELIGSADGKKYRNFAQGLTFDIMIGHANRQLCKMTDRYLLLRDEAQPLELNVLDNYQAGEIRSTKNLSGGESFIVSLALALGLSQMASRNVRLDSLFLDEGFGTLDEEALETALETLAGLQRDGKLIGVISHLPALKERIGTQIQVVHQAGGRSVIVGPGCSAVRPSAPVSRQVT